ncbi:MAG: phospholipid carrier-dependent glycosyltransferase [Nanoarchaeota archaeon]|nr:phospholipid carrier-dependent glycosyltransferase [Nanoarchaeota archaeon]
MTNKLSKFILKEKYLFLTLVLALILRVIFLAQDYALWWDSYVYIGMGKAIFTLGEIGIWEPFRPLIWPFILGFIWKLGLPVLFIGKVLDVVFSLTAIVFAYLFAKKIGGKLVANIVAFIMAISLLLIMHTGFVLTEPLALSFGMLGLYFFVIRNYKEKRDTKINGQVKNNWFYLILTGILLALAFLTKYPLGILWPSVMLIILLRKNKYHFGRYKKYFDKEEWKLKLKEWLLISISFIIVITPYLILNYILYKNPFEPFLSGNWIVSTDTWLYGTGIWFYLINFFFVDIVFMLCIIPLGHYIWKRKWKDEPWSLIVIPAVLITAYFSFSVARKELRYLVIALPFFAMMLAFLVDYVYRYFKKFEKPTIRPNALIFVMIIIIILSQWSFFGNNTFYETYYHEELDDEISFMDRIVETISNNGNKEAILSSSPALLERLDLKIYPTGNYWEAKDIYGWNKHHIEFVYLNSCDFRCEEGDTECQDNVDSFFELVRSENSLVLIQEVEEIRRIGNTIERYQCKISLFKV